MKIGQYFSLAEVERSDTAKRLRLNNKLPIQYYENAQNMVDNLLDPLRTFYAKPILISSWYRSPELNTIIKGAVGSHHLTANAVDIDQDPVGPNENAKVFDIIKNNFLFHTLIWEFGTDENPDWVHVSFFKNESPKRILRAYNVNGKTIYNEYKR
jgi:hypothetical protein